MKHKKKKRKLPISYNMFGFPVNVITNAASIMLYENIGAIIENYCCLVTYTDSIVKLKTGLGFISISGDKLMINEVEPGCLNISGKISSVMFDYFNCN